MNVSRKSISASSLSYKRPRRKDISCFDYLSDDVFQSLLSYVTQKDLLMVAIVAKRWKDTASSSNLWKEVSIEFFKCRDVRAVDSLLQFLISSKGDFIESLCLGGNSPSLVVLDTVFTNVKNLRQLDVSNCRSMTDELVELVARSCRKLQKFRASQCRFLTDQSLMSLGRCCNMLEIVRLDHCRLVSSDGVRCMLNGCRDLKEIGLRGCPKVINQTLIDIANTCRNVEVVQVGGSGKMKDSGVLALSRECKFLKVLDISTSNPFVRNVDVTDVGMIELITRCRNIVSLALKGLSSISPNTLLAIREYCSEIKSLDIGGCKGIAANPEVLNVVLTSFKSLEFLSLWDCSFVTDETIKSISAGCPNLKKVDLDGCCKVSNSSVQVLKNVSTLKSFYMNGKDHITSPAEKIL